LWQLIQKRFRKGLILVCTVLTALQSVTDTRTVTNGRTDGRLVDS